jgi:hypothetical protein
MRQMGNARKCLVSFRDGEAHQTRGGKEARSGGSVDLGADGGEATPREVSLEGNC